MILCVGDAHYKKNNALLTDMFQQELLILIEQRKIKNIVLLGDYHDSWDMISSPVLNRLFNFFVELSAVTNVYYVVGNHDLINNNQFCSEEHFFNSFKTIPNVFIIDKPVTYMVGDVLAAFIPFVVDGKFNEALQQINQKYHILFTHNEFSGAIMGSLVSTSTNSWPITNPLLVSGHIHTKQWLQKNLYYPGVPYDIHFENEDSADKTVSILTTNQRGFDVEEICLGLPTKRILNMTIQEFESHKWNEKTLSSIKVLVSGTSEDLTALSKRMKNIPKNIKVVFTPINSTSQQREKRAVSFIDSLMELTQTESEEIKDLVKQVVDET
jgi:DNA repair exonuclease SbcCD nuclease subunit